MSQGLPHFTVASALLAGCGLLADIVGLQIMLLLMTAVLSGLVVLGVVAKHRTALRAS